MRQRAGRTVPDCFRQSHPLAQERRGSDGFLLASTDRLPRPKRSARSWTLGHD